MTTPNREEPRSQVRVCVQSGGTVVKGSVTAISGHIATTEARKPAASCDIDHMTRVLVFDNDFLRLDTLKW